MTDTTQFMKDLNEEVKGHPAIHHSFLETVSSRPFSRRAWLAFAQQLYPHVHFFIPYMEEMLLNTFDMNAKLIVAKILLDEYGEDAEGASHPELFRRFVRACGGTEGDASLLKTPLQQATVDLVEKHILVEKHMTLCREGSFLQAIGAIGPAHEYAIGFLFPPLVKGMKLSGFSDQEMEFFSLHVDHDVEHSKMLEDTMIRLALTDRDRAEIREGTMKSLAARADLWSAMEKRMLAAEKGETAPATDRTLLDMTKSYKNVPDTFWPS
jgi:pyrroloquinoline quinone (PQQ) biosynthesis protein C